MKTLLLTTLAFFSAQVTDGPRTFSSMDAAAIFALQTSYDMSPYYEYGGVVTQAPSGPYVDTYPITDYHGDSVMIDQDFTSYNLGYPVVATYHTHPCLPSSHYPGVFSPDDIHIARASMRPAYMLDMCTGNVHVFDPSKDKVDQVIEVLVLVTAGRIVGHVNVSGAPLELTK